MNEKPIGIFDSGLGGLTVTRQVMQQMPNESIVYLGDTARVPYGARSHETVIQYAIECIEFLLQHDVKMVIIACGTASATALKVVRNQFDIPIIGVIDAGAYAAVAQTKNKSIGVAGTSGTIKSHAHRKAIHQLEPSITVVEKACPLFVPLAEEGWGDSEIAYLTSKKYLSDMKQQNVDTVILGCTHYPLLTNSIQRVMEEHVTLIDPAVKTAEQAKELLNDRNIEAKNKETTEHVFFITDFSQQFKQIASRFLGKEIKDIKKAVIPIKK